MNIPSVDEGVTKFTDILKQYPTWKMLADGQFVRHLAIFQSLALRDALFKIERVYQEFFLSTALNKSSVLAHIEDREYIPRKAVPSSGIVTIRNESDQTYYITDASLEPDADTLVFISNKQLPYVVALADGEPNQVSPGASVNVTVHQKERYEQDFTVDIEKPFFEILLPADISGKVSEFEVRVENDQQEYEKWEYARLFLSDSENTYDEFFSRTERIGVRFGNGTFGKILTSGTKIKIMAWLTEGDTDLLENQTLNTEDADITVKTYGMIGGGMSPETYEESRVNLHYWGHNDTLVWGNDYKFFIRRNVPGIIWLNIWGEQEAEAMNGAPDSDYINKIFISAYHPDKQDAELETLVLGHLANVRPVNITYEWVPPIHKTFTVAMSGEIPNTKNVTDVITGIRTVLESKYGKDSAGRMPKVYEKDLYSMISDTGDFSSDESWFEVVIAKDETYDEAMLDHMLYIDIENSEFTLTVVG